MARSPRSGFKSLTVKPQKPRKPVSAFSPPKPDDMPAPRNFAYERVLCEAIHQCAIVEIRYDDDLTARRYAPDVIYSSSKGKMLVGGRQINGLAQPEPKNFEVGKIRSVRVTDDHFTRDPRFNIHDMKYRNRICPR
jgi:hypothetical protein